MNPDKRTEKSDNYSKNLFAVKLKRAYETAPSRIQQYLNAELVYVLDQIKPSDTVLELGCGYGRVLKRIAEKATTVVGIDISEASLEFAKDYLRGIPNIQMHFMTARNIKFPEQTFDVVLGIQNALSATKIDPPLLLSQALRVTKTGGKIILSSYSEKIWEERLKWFIRQAEEGLLGDIDYDKTGNGVITCKDGFRATTFTKEDFTHLIDTLELKAKIQEIDDSCIFCVITKNT